MVRCTSHPTIHDDTMFRCFLRPRGSIYVSPSWLPSLANSGCRGIKMSKSARIPKMSSEYIQLPLAMSRHDWIDQLTKNGIGHFNDCTRVQELKNIIIVKASERHVRKFTDDVYFTDIGHPFAEAVVRRYLRDHQEKPLWWITSIHSSDKAIVRGKFKCRAHAAFNQALRNAGYDSAGRRIAERKGAARTGPASDLFGTVNISTREPKEIQKIPFTSLREFFERVVKDLERRLGKTAVSRNAIREGETSRTHFQRSQHQTRYSSPKQTGVRGSGDRGPHVARRGTPHEWGGNDGGHRKSGQQSSRQPRARDNTSINTSF